jgi:hypothetical protein
MIVKSIESEDKKNDCEKLKGYFLILENFLGFALFRWHESNFGNKAQFQGSN